MASIYKKNRQQGKKREPWYVDYTDYLGQRKTVKGFSDRRETDRLLETLVTAIC